VSDSLVLNAIAFNDPTIAGEGVYLAGMLLNRVHLKSQKHIRCEVRGFFDVQIVLQNTLNEADGVLLAKPNSRKQ